MSAAPELLRVAADHALPQRKIGKAGGSVPLSRVGASAQNGSPCACAYVSASASVRRREDVPQPKAYLRPGSSNVGSVSTDQPRFDQRGRPPM